VPVYTRKFKVITNTLRYKIAEISSRKGTNARRQIQNLVSIFILQNHWLRFIIYTRLFKIFKRGIRICFPELFYFVNLLGTNLTGSQLLLF
jgi:hypothetical protein